MEWLPPSYGQDATLPNIGSLGPNAIIVDGWMNDAYPARHFLARKHGLNYNNTRINIKQFTTRNMVCVSYRNHVEVLRDFGVLSAGKCKIAKRSLLRTVF